MPMFEYVCEACETDFECLVLGADPPSCPACGSSDLEKQVSLSAVSTANSQQRALSGAEERTKKLRFDRSYEDHKVAHKHHD